MTDQPTGDPTDRLTYQQIDALWDAVAIPGPTAPTFPMQHERVCRAVAEILDEMAPAAPAVPAASPPPDQTALRDRIAEVLYEQEQGPNAPRWVDARPGNREIFEPMADAVLAVLPPSADRAAAPVFASPPADYTTDPSFVPPAVEGFWPAVFDSATDGASALDAWARTPHGRNFLAHALAQLARDGWLRTKPGEGFEPVHDRDDTPEPQDPAELRRLAAEAQQPETRP